MPKCNKCGFDKPKGEVYLGICDDCFHGRASKDTSPASAAKIFIDNNIILTTSIDIPNRHVDSVISIVASEAAIGMSIFKDIANNWRDFFGGRSETSQNALKETREACLEGLRMEASRMNADAVISVNFAYNQLSTGSTGGILFVAATGTAVKLRPA